MLRPDPADLPARVVLVDRQPQFALLRDDIKDLTHNVRQIRIPTFTARTVDIKLVDTGRKKQHRRLLGRLAVSRGVLVRVVRHGHCGREETRISTGR